MRQENKQIIAGFLLSGLLVGALAFVHSKSAIKDEDNFVLHAQFLKTDGLMNGADVRLAGIKVGHVTEQKLSSGYRVDVKMSFLKPIDLSIDSSALIETDGLLGAKHIELLPGGDDEILKNGEEITFTQDALILGELLDKVNTYMREKKGQEKGNEQKISQDVISRNTSIANKDI